MFLNKKQLMILLIASYSMSVAAGELDDLSGLSDLAEPANTKNTQSSNSLSQSLGDSLESMSEPAQDNVTESSNSIQFSGYVKPLG